LEIVYYYEGLPYTGGIWDWDDDYYMEASCKDGRLHGLKREFYSSNFSNRPMMFEGNYQNGKPDGFHQKWYRNGQLEMKGNYHLDAIGYGLWQYWYENGQLKQQITFKDGKRDGLYQRWDESGQLVEESNWQDGVRID